MQRFTCSITQWGILTLLVGSAFALLLMGCFGGKPHSVTPPKSQVDESDIADYLGNEACRSCHTKEFQEHHGSYHDLTLHAMDSETPKDLTPPVGQINNSQYAIVEEKGRLHFEVDVPTSQDKYQLWPLDFVFGSGKSGITFVSMLEGHNVVEMKMSYFPPEKRWRVTPGQRLDNPISPGDIGNLVQSRRCLGCHSVAMSKNTFVPRPEFYGVGCESCHGPGRSHVTAMQSGSKGIPMTPLKKLGATQLNTLCGKCHQTEKDVIASPMMAKMTYRFQPYGLMKSVCFQKSGDTLSCLTCHPAHSNSSTQSETYVPACLSCHSAPGTVAAAGKPAPKGKVCPVNATSDCIRCHMPKRDVLTAMGQTAGVYLTEHKIGIYRP